jgi:hypothetical protein
MRFRKKLAIARRRRPGEKRTSSVRPSEPTAWTTPGGAVKARAGNIATLLH